MHKRRIVWGAAAIAALCLLLLGSSVLAQPEVPLSEMTLGEEKIPVEVGILSEGQNPFDDPAHPINEVSSKEFFVHPYREGYHAQYQGTGLAIGQYLYRYDTPKQAVEQTEAFVEYVQNNDKVKALAPVVREAAVDRLILEVDDTEGTGRYYWFIENKGNILMMLMVGGLPGESTESIFDNLRLQLEEQVESATR